MTTSNSPTYGVGAPYASGAGSRDKARTAQRPCAVFIAHGMGQQVRFATLDDFAHGLCAEAERRDVPVHGRTARTVRVGCTEVQRLEIEIEGKRPIHIYEGYWAPLTEGLIKLRDVLRFLVGASVNGIRSGGKLHRWLFGEPREFTIPGRDVFRLWLALIVLLSIVGVGATIVTVGLARLTFAGHLRWLTDNLVIHLTGVFETLLATLIVCAAVAVVLVPAIRKSRKLAPLLWIPAGVAGVAFVLSAIVIALQLLRDLPPPFAALCDHPAAAWCFDLFDASVRPLLERLDLFFCRVEGILRWLLIASGVFAVVAMLIWMIVARPREPEKARARGTGARGAALVALIAAAALLFVAICRVETVALLTWLLLLAFALVVRWFLIQYVGDVAAYISPHVVDRFFDLRNRVRETVWKAARAVYALRDGEGHFVYDTVLVAGHSLGSVVVYDVLNRLMNEDDLAGGDAPECCGGEPAEPLDVRGRTKLLLTYGSPLDKTAFLFSMQDTGAGSERDALAATLQPLIKDNPRAFRWKNIWSRYDIFSGPLEFYDTPKHDLPPNSSRVENEHDADANILIAAHNQYGEGPLLFGTLYDAI